MTLVKIKDKFNEEAWCRFVKFEDNKLIVRHYGEDYVTPLLDILEFESVVAPK